MSSVKVIDLNETDKQDIPPIEEVQEEEYEVAVEEESKPTEEESKPSEESKPTKEVAEPKQNTKGESKSKSSTKSRMQYL